MTKRWAHNTFSRCWLYYRQCSWEDRVQRLSVFIRVHCLGKARSFYYILLTFLRIISIIFIRKDNVMLALYVWLLYITIIDYITQLDDPRINAGLFWCFICNAPSFVWRHSKILCVGYSKYVWEKLSHDTCARKTWVKYKVKLRSLHDYSLYELILFYLVFCVHTMS